MADGAAGLPGDNVSDCQPTFVQWLTYWIILAGFAMIESVLGTMVPRCGLSPMCACAASILSVGLWYWPPAHDASPHR